MRATPLNDLVTGAVMVAFGTWVLIVTMGYPSTSGGFPFALTAYMIVPLGLLLLVKGILRLRLTSRTKEDKPAEGAETQLVQFTPITIGVIIAVCVATLAIGWLGFIASVGVLAAATGLLFRMPLWTTAIYVAGQSIVLWAFLRFFNIQMPEGLLL